MSRFNTVEVGLGNRSGELLVVNRNRNYFLMLTDHEEYRHVPIRKKTYEALKEEFIYNELVKD